MGTATAAATRAADIKAQVNAAFKKDVLQLGSEVDIIRHWPTGMLPIDMALDGGLPVGRFIEVYGDYSTLKSLLALKAVASVQAYGGTTAYVDAEHAFDKVWAREQGVDTDSMLLQRPDTGEEAIGVMEVLIRSGTDLIIWDSIAATQPAQYAEKKPGEDNQPGGQARMMSAGLRRLNTANKSSTILAINQTRVNVGMTFGSKTTTPGGMAMPFYASYRMNFIKAGRESEDYQFWTGEKMDTGKRQTKQRIKCVMTKWKLTAPMQEVWFDYDMRLGDIDEVGFIIGWAIEQGYIIAGANGRYSIDEITIHGKDKFFTHMYQDTETIEWFRKQMMEGFSLASPGRQAEAPKSKAGGRKPKP